VCNPEKITLCLPKGANIRIEMTVPETISAPIEEGEIVAVATCYFGEQVVYVINLESTERAEVKKKSLWGLFGD
jgi:hypothetical protein